jgi:hypothetical protein
VIADLNNRDRLREVLEPQATCAPAAWFSRNVMELRASSQIPVNKEAQTIALVRALLVMRKRTRDPYHHTPQPTDAVEGPSRANVRHAQSGPAFTCGRRRRPNRRSQSPRYESPSHG